MSNIIENARLTPDDWHDAVNRALHAHDETHAVSTVRARKYIPTLTEMISECGVSGVVVALASAIRHAARRRQDGVDDPLVTDKTAGRVWRFARMLRLRNAADDVRNALAPDDDSDEPELRRAA